MELAGFAVGEVPAWEKLWQRGGFPRAYLAASDADCAAWTGGFIRTFLERDLAQLGVRTSAQTLRRFRVMLAHYHAQSWNGAELGRALGVSAHSVRHYLDLLTDTFVVRQLLPWFENVGKRLRRAPKIYIRDSGIVHALLGAHDATALQGHPKVGASWEGFALEEVLRHVSGEPYVWALYERGEIDLVMMGRSVRIGFEFKYADAPGVTHSMRQGMKDLGLARLYVVYPGRVAYAMAEGTDAVPLQDVAGLGLG